ncbi:MAG: tyrosine-type recombinase/integrase [Thermoleophilia bacterium]
MGKLTKRQVDKVTPDDTKAVFLWDDELRGFGLRVAPGGTKSFVVQYRVRGRERRTTIGRYGPLSVDAARRSARQMLAAAARGEDPAEPRTNRREPTVSELAAEFLERYPANKKRPLKPSTMEQYVGMVTNHIVPFLGKRLVADVSRDDIDLLHQSMKEWPYAANRTLAVLSKMFNMAEVWKYRTPQTNPCRLIDRNPETARRRHLNARELTKLGVELRNREAEDPFVVLAFRLLLFTGARVGEVLTLQWEQVDLEERVLRLPDSKTGSKDLILSKEAVRLLDGAPRVDGSPWVIPGRFPEKHLSALRHKWAAIRKDAGLEDVQIHDLRRTFASMAAFTGSDLMMIGSLLGHSNPATTQKYTYLYPDPKRDAADRTVDVIASALGAEPSTDDRDAREPKD